MRRACMRECVRVRAQGKSIIHRSEQENALPACEALPYPVTNEKKKSAARCNQVLPEVNDVPSVECMINMSALRLVAYGTSIEPT